MLVNSSNLDKINLDMVMPSSTHQFYLLFPALDLPRKFSSPEDGCLLPLYQEKKKLAGSHLHWWIRMRSTVYQKCWVNIKQFKDLKDVNF